MFGSMDKAQKRKRKKKSRDFPLFGDLEKKKEKLGFYFLVFSWRKRSGKKGLHGKMLKKEYFPFPPKMNGKGKDNFSMQK